MISLAPTCFAAHACREIACYPGELSDRPIRLGRILVCSPVEVGIRPPYALGGAHARHGPATSSPRPCDAPRPRPTRRAPEVVLPGRAGARRAGAAARRRRQAERVADLGGGDPSGALERTLSDLYRAGYLSPPAGLWVTEAGMMLAAEVT